ncbi:MAG TPA: PhzF family phenazine biosynthesis protein [Thermoleophilaceae bacterium]|nr:PhzF family phenazine biosynthesis protein [Thermoleophilaceae bacterium]
MARLHLLRVFCDPADGGGNALAVFLDGDEVPAERRPAVAAELGLSETVFVDDPAAGAIRIFTPTTELPFAGHPTVGTAWLLAREREPVAVLRPPAGELAVRYSGDEAFVSGRPEWGPHFDFVELGSPAEVDALAGPPGGTQAAVWAFVDEAAGVVRARVFPLEIGIAEDEATGSAAVQLGARLDRELDIRQGRGSRIVARPLGDGTVEIGGRSVVDEVRDHPLPGA